MQELPLQPSTSTEDSDHDNDIDDSQLPSILSPPMVSVQSISSPTPSVHGRMRDQFKEFVIKLSANDTSILYLTKRWNNVACVREKYQITLTRYYVPKRILFGLILFLFILMVCDWTLNVYVFSTLYFSILSHAWAVMTFLSIILSTNVFILKQASHSFTFWYTVIHIGIANWSRMVYHNFWKVEAYRDDPHWIVNYANGVFATISLMLLFATISTMDGYHPGRIYNVGMKNNRVPIVKRIFMIVSILLCMFYWTVVYFNVHGFDRHRAIVFHVFGRRYIFYWRVIVLSSIFKSCVFLSAQIFHNYIHPHRVNGVPMSVQMEPVKFDDDTYNGYDMSIMRSSTNLLNMGVFNRIISRSVSPKAADHDHNYDIMYDFSQQIIMNMNMHMQQEPACSDFINGQKSDINPDFVATPRDGKKFILAVVVEKTIFYVILRKVFKQSRENSVSWSKLLLHRYTVVSLSTIVGIMTIIVLVIESGKVLDTNSCIPPFLKVIYHIMSLLIYIVFFLNINQKYAYFKRRSLPVYWKVFNVTTMWMCIYALEIEYKYNRHNKDSIHNISSTEDFSLDVFNSVISSIGWSFLAFSATLLNGYFFSSKLKVLLLLLMIGMCLGEAALYFFDERDVHIEYIIGGAEEGHESHDHEHGIEVIDVSIRSVIVSKAIDNALWFSNQLYNTWKDDTKLWVTSKIRIRWQI